jgi:hypothetical protein
LFFCFAFAFAFAFVCFFSCSSILFLYFSFALLLFLIFPPEGGTTNLCLCPFFVCAASLREELYQKLMKRQARARSSAFRRAFGVCKIFKALKKTLAIIIDRVREKVL